MAQLRQRQPELDALGAAVYVVSFEEPRRLRAYIRVHKIAFPMLADPHRRVYRAYGLSRGPWWQIYSPRVLWRYLKLLVGGARVRIRGDTLQRGGDFVVDADSVLRLAHAGKDSFDRPPVDDLLRACARRHAASSTDD